MHVSLYIQSDFEAQRIMQLLESQAGRCERFPTAAALMHAAGHRAFDAMVLDAREGPSWYETMLSWARCRACAATPLIFLCNDSSPQCTVRALEAGADVLVAPYAPEELAARIQATHRRAANARTRRPQVELAGFTLDHDAGWMLDRGRTVDLTAREFMLAWFLFSNPSAFASREAISHAVWGVGWDIVGHSVEQHVYKLRKKLNLCKERGVTIRASYGRGYRLEIHELPQADFGSTVPAALDEHASALHIASLIEASWSHKRFDAA